MLSLRLCGLGWFFWGVLLSACARHGSGQPPAERASALSIPGQRPGSQLLNPTGNERLSYTVNLDPSLQRLEVRVCPSGFRLTRLAAPSAEAQSLLLDNRVVTPSKTYLGSDDGVELTETRPNECAAYVVRLPEQLSQSTSYQRVGEDLLISPDLWLWEPLPRPLDRPLQLRLTLPPSLRPALPWPTDERGAEAEREPQGPGRSFAFLVPQSAFAWKSAGAFSRAEPSPLQVPGASLRLVALGSGFGEHDRDLRQWLEAGARASASLYGRFPVPRALVLAVPRERPGPSFGMALRGGGPAIVLLVEQNPQAATLAQDWTAAHEFLHLGVPRLPPEDAWLFEGLATYYTEVTRARAGLISPQRAAQHLLDGFQRGRSQPSSLTLREESAQMRERRSFTRVYWAGAALSLMTDVAARRAGGPSLDDALREFAACCANSEREWNAARMLARLDRTLGAPHFTALARRWLDRSEFPAIEPLLLRLGVRAGRQGEAHFGAAPDSSLRDALFAPGTPRVATQ